jgi:hypothetical protein
LLKNINPQTRRRFVMNRFVFLSGFVILVFLASLALAGIPRMINYQGMLTQSDGKTPVTNGNYPILFSIFNTSSGGSSLWTHTYNVSVTNGLFNVILGDSSAAINLPFDTTYWLGIKVGADLELSPRIRLTSVGYAYRSQRADTASYAGSGPWGGNNAWTFRITDTADTTLWTGGRWGIARYGNTLYGNVDSTHVNLGVACTTGTNGQNYKYCTVAGGVSNTASRNYATVGGGQENRSNAILATVGGGWENTASGTYAIAGGGENNTASGYIAVVGGGGGNIASGYAATVAGGYENTASNFYATVGGGYSNSANDSGATIGGGMYDTASGASATIGGGSGNTSSEDWSTVGGGLDNTASGGYATVGGGTSNKARGSFATVGGGSGNTSSEDWSTVGGGLDNTASGYYGTVGGGAGNTDSGWAATVAGGYLNTASGDYSFVAGSRVRIASGANYTFAFGREFTTSTPNAVIFHNSVDPIKVGVGTPSPGSALHVVSSSSYFGMLRLQNSNTGNNEATMGFIGGSEVGHETWLAGIGAWSTGRDFVIGLNGAKLVITAADGNVGIGTISPGGYKLAVNGTAAKTGGGSWDSFSDIRLKEVDGNYEYGLKEISQLNPIRYSYKKDNDLGLPAEQKFVGLVAQQVQGIIPDAVKENDKGYLMVNNDPIIWAMLNAIKELKAENESLRKRIEVLESR